LRRRQIERERARQGRPVPTEDYGFHLSDGDAPKPAPRNNPDRKKADDYGFKLD
jgi:hypothetical protein